MMLAKRDRFLKQHITSCDPPVQLKHRIQQTRCQRGLAGTGFRFWYVVKAEEENTKPTTRENSLEIVQQMEGSEIQDLVI